MIYVLRQIISGGTSGLVPSQALRDRNADRRRTYITPRSISPLPHTAMQQRVDRASVQAQVQAVHRRALQYKAREACARDDCYATTAQDGTIVRDEITRASQRQFRAEAVTKARARSLWRYDDCIMITS
jgi:hypothetical protein